MVNVSSIASMAPRKLHMPQVFLLKLICHFVGYGCGDILLEIE